VISEVVSTGPSLAADTERSSGTVPPSTAAPPQSHRQLRSAGFPPAVGPPGTSRGSHSFPVRGRPPEL